MRAMTGGVLIPFLLACLAARAAEPPFTGRFLGTGRACYGTLAVRSKTISWLTSFSQCRDLPYELVARDDGGGRLRLTYRFTRGAPACRYQLISLTHDGSRDQDTGWEVTGYGAAQSYLADKASAYTTHAPDTMSCYLIRDPGQQRPGRRQVGLK